MTAKYDEAVIRRVVELRENGHSSDDVGHMLGLTGDQVSGIYRRAPAEWKGKRTSLVKLRETPGIPLKPPPSKQVEHPKGWEPGVVLEGRKGTVGGVADHPFAPIGENGRNKDWDGVLRHFGFDPELFEILEPVNVRTWDANVGEGVIKQMWYHKANIIQRRSNADLIDVKELIREIKSHKHKPSGHVTGDSAFVMCASDWQLGKADNDSTKSVVERVLDSTDLAVDRIKELRKGGRRLGVLYYVGMGDLVEGCTGHYEMQEFQVVLDRRDQVKVARRLILHQLRHLSPLFERVVVTCVPGNHGENRKRGKAFTTWGDNDDVAVFEQVAEILQENPEAYGHISFIIPDQELVATFDVCGTVTAFAHGHQARGGGNGRGAQLEHWWRGQQAGRQPAGDADLLIVGHGHHLLVVQNGVRTIIQCPSLESDSAWFRHMAGLSCPPGVMTLVVGPNGWSDMQVLRPLPQPESESEAA